MRSKILSVILLVVLLLMAGLLALVGGMGLAGTMSLSVLERIREVGVLRAVIEPAGEAATHLQLQPEDPVIVIEKVIAAAGAPLIHSLNAISLALLPADAQPRGAELAGAREALDENFIVESQVVGITGERVAPNLYIALGIRGDTMHTWGMKGARYVVAVHPDPDAPILKQADAALVGDPAKVAKELVEALRAGVEYAKHPPREVKRPPYPKRPGV